jgi:hypothetical protein
MYSETSPMGATSSMALRCLTLSWAGVRRVAPCALGALTLSMLALLACGVRAAAQESGSLTFATAQPLTLTWAQLLHGKSIEVCNGGAATVPRIRAVPVDFAFTREGDAVAPSRVLTIKPPTHPIRASECAPIRIALTSETAIDRGEYDGSLLLVAAGHGGSVRLATKVTTASKKAAAPAGVSEPTTLSIHNASPWSHNATAVLLVKEPSPTEAPLAIGKGCGAAAPSDSDCPALGNLYQDARVVRVSVDGPSRFNADKGVQEVPIELHAFQHAAGSYEGSVTLPGSTQAIKLKLGAKDAWWCAVVALLLGVLLALATQLWNGRWQPRHALVERAEQLRSRYGTKPVTGHERVELDSGKLDDYLEGVKQAIARYASSVVMFDGTSDAYKAIDASLKVADDDAVVFRGPGGLRPLLDQLNAEAKATVKLLRFMQVADVPELVKAASELLGGEKLGVGGATKRVKEAEALLPMLASWHELMANFMEHVVWLKALTDTRVAQDKLRCSGVKMSGLRQRLFEVKDGSELAALRSSASLWTTLDRIAYLAQTWNVPRPDRFKSPLPLDRDDNLDLKSVGKLELDAIGYFSAKGDALKFDEVLDHPAGVVVEPAKPATLPEPRRLRIVGDLLALATTTVVSIVAGLSTFYFTKSFGTFEDYLTVIVVGSAAQTLLKGILNQTSILLHDFAPSSPAVPAMIVSRAPA